MTMIKTHTSIMKNVMHLHPVSLVCVLTSTSLLVCGLSLFMLPFALPPHLSRTKSFKSTLSTYTSSNTTASTSIKVAKVDTHVSGSNTHLSSELKIKVEAEYILRLPLCERHPPNQHGHKLNAAMSKHQEPDDDVGHYSASMKATAHAVYFQKTVRGTK